MKIRVPGDKTRVSCKKCGAFRQGSWNYGTLVMEDGTAIEQVMQSYCDVCSEPCSIAHQSAWKLREAREAKTRTRTSILVSLPLFDLTAGKVSELGGEAKRGPELLTMAVLGRLTRDPKRIPTFASRLRNLESPLLKKPAKKMNLNLTSAHSRVLNQLKEATSLSQSELIRRALIASESDPKVTKELRLLLGSDETEDS